MPNESSNQRIQNEKNDARTQQLYRIRSKMGNLKIVLPKSSTTEKEIRLKRMNSYSPRKNKATLAALFKQARKVNSCETYLQNGHQNKFITRIEPLTPKYLTNKFSRNVPSPYGNVKAKKNSVNTHFQGEPIKRQNNIYKTIQITVNGNTFNVNKSKIMNTLSQIILGQEIGIDNALIGTLDESTIVATEQNCFGISEIFLMNEMIKKAGQQMQ